MKGNNGKDAYWFSHDSNAKDDPKCMLLIDQLGLEGYGIYWVLVEILREQPDFSYPIALIPAIAKRYGTSVPKVEAVISGFGLFDIRDDKFFYSPSLITRVLAFKEKQDAKSAAAIKANMIRWQREKEKKLLADTQLDNTSGIQMESERNPNLSQGNKIKGKESIIDSSFHSESSPTQKELSPEEFMLLWNEGRGTLPKVAALNKDRKAKAKLRIKEMGKTKEEQRDTMLIVMEKIRNSEFLTVKWGKCNFDWLIGNATNWLKAYEGNYDNKDASAGVKDIRDIKDVNALWRD